MNLRELEIAHDHSTANRGEIQRSATCRCFYCLKQFPPSEISEWIPDRAGETAVCPRCGIDSVIGSVSGIAMSDAVFEELRDHWFDAASEPT
jgi:NAD-dependent SIR2 family protein deacetylase